MLPDVDAFRLPGEVTKGAGGDLAEIFGPAQRHATRRDELEVGVVQGLGCGNIPGHEAREAGAFNLAQVDDGLGAAHLLPYIVRRMTMPTPYDGSSKLFQIGLKPL